MGHTYTLVEGEGDDDNDSFTIPENTNELRANDPFNVEEKDEYTLRVRTTDAGGLWHEELFTIYIDDVNDAPVAE